MAQVVGQIRLAGIALALAFVAGFVDCVGFMALGFFPAHITGNFVLVGDILAGTSGGLAIRLTAFLVFMAAVAITGLGLRWRRMHGNASIRALCIVEALLIVGFAVLGGHAVSGVFAHGETSQIAAGLGAAAMGIQSAGFHRHLPEPATTAMTGNVTKLVLELTDFVLDGGGGAVPERITRLAALVVGFAMGALIGAISVYRAGFLALAIPVVVLLALAAVPDGARAIREPGKAAG